MTHRLRALRCWLLGHRFATKTLDGRGRRIQYERCTACGLVKAETMTVKPANRAMRRRWARSVAKELAR